MNQLLCFVLILVLACVLSYGFALTMRRVIDQQPIAGGRTDLIVGVPYRELIADRWWEDIKMTDQVLHYFYD